MESLQPFWNKSTTEDRMNTNCGLGELRMRSFVWWIFIIVLLKAKVLYLKTLELIGRGYCPIVGGAD